MFARLRFAVPVLVAAAAAAPCRADAVDLALVNHSAAVMKAVRGLGGESVAVLNFAVQTGDAAPAFDAGLANVKLAQKLENLLVLANDPDRPLLVLTGAAKQAADLPPTATWTTAEGRKALAGLKNLSLVWAKDQNELTPDAFVTGVLKLTPGKAAAKVALVGFTRKDPDKLVTLFETPDAPTETARPVAADRSLLALAGVSYGRPDGDLAARIGRPLDVKATMDACPVKLEVLVNGVPADVLPDGKNLGAGRLATGGPKAGDALVFRVTNTGDRPYAVVLAVNGRNTNSLGRDPYLTAKEAKDQRMWVLDPKKSVELKGFYTDEKGSFDEFRVLDDAASAAAYRAMGEQFRGLITMHVFGEKAAAPAAPPGGLPLATTPEAEAAKKDEREATVVTLGLGGSALEEVRASGDLAVARDRAQALANVTKAGELEIRADPAKALQAADRGLIAESGVQQQGGPINVVKFAFDPNPIGFVQLRYYGQ